MSRKVAVVLAAGKGTRMQSDLPKVLIPILGRPMIEYVLEALEASAFDEILLVVGYRSDLVREALAGRRNLTFVEQPQQLGTGHAVMVCRDVLARHTGPVVVVTGDAPMLQAASIGDLLTEFERTRPACLIGTLVKDQPDGLGRIVRDARGNFAAIVEQKDATPEQLQVKEVNMSCYVFDCQLLLNALASLRADNAQGEYYITDCPGLLRGSGRAVEALPVLRPIEALGVNTREELTVVEEALAGKQRGES